MSKSKRSVYMDVEPSVPLATIQGQAPAMQAASGIPVDADVAFDVDRNGYCRKVFFEWEV